jgi:hypothetical protein
MKSIPKMIIINKNNNDGTQVYKGDGLGDQLEEREGTGA